MKKARIPKSEALEIRIEALVETLKIRTKKDSCLSKLGFIDISMLPGKYQFEFRWYLDNRMNYYLIDELNYERAGKLNININLISIDNTGKGYSMNVYYKIRS